jgi:dolichol-phosphate mannosyltransferase
MKHIVVLIPTLNEELNVQNTVEQVFAQRTMLRSKKLSVLIVDSNSPDKTRAIIKKLQNTYANLYLVNYKQPGLGAALKKGLAHAYTKLAADLVITLDCDGSHDPSLIPTIVEQSTQSDILVGSRYSGQGSVNNWSWYRKVLSFVGNGYLQLMLPNIKTSDFTSNYRAYSSETIKKLLPYFSSLSNTWSLLTELLVAANQLQLQTSEFAIVFSDRKFGQSKLNAFQYTTHLLLLPWRYTMDAYKERLKNEISFNFNVGSYLDRNRQL